ncbi:MAG: DUF364 domain-containing protein [Deltaproteobacteria bacterium]|nr:DUF364 domain-containing protein [Deltaproteobacteria bacterium]
MKILDDLISILDVEASVKDIRQGVFHTAVVTRYCGLAATLPRDALRQEPPLVKEPGLLTDKKASELLRLVYSDSILEAAIGMAAINSLIEVNETLCAEINASEIIMEKGKGKKIAVVGHFPFLQRVRDIADTLWVIEKNPVEGDFKEQDADSLIPQADVVAITGTSLTNHSFEHLMTLCQPKAFVIILGDTAPLSSIFFDYGVDAVSGTKVVNSSLALRCVCEGANFRQIKGTRRLTMVKPG